MRQIIKRASQDGQDFEFDRRLLMPDGSVKHVHVVAHAERDESGEIEFVGAVMDVSDRKRAEEAMRRSEGYLADAQKLTHTGSWAWNVRTGALFWSQEIFRIYNFEPQERVLLAAVPRKGSPRGSIADRTESENGSLRKGVGRFSE
jgi:PAS domain-containing protein